MAFGFLLSGLLDVLVDGHFAIVQQLDDSIEELQDLLFSENRKQIHAVQRGTARPGHNYPGGQHHHPGQPNEPDHEEGNQLAAIIAGPTAITGFYGQNVHNPGCPASSTSPSNAKTGCESWIRMTARAGHSLFIREPAGYP